MSKQFVSDGLGELFSVEYSQEQDKLHIDNVDRALSMNNEIYRTEVDWEWRLVGLFKTFGEASAYCAYLREEHRLALTDLRDG